MPYHGQKKGWTLQLTLLSVLLVPERHCTYAMQLAHRQGTHTPDAIDRPLPSSTTGVQRSAHMLANK